MRVYVCLLNFNSGACCPLIHFTFTLLYLNAKAHNVRPHLRRGRGRTPFLLC